MVTKTFLHSNICESSGSSDSCDSSDSSERSDSSDSSESSDISEQKLFAQKNYFFFNQKLKRFKKTEWWQNSSCDKTQIVTKVKCWQKSKLDKNLMFKKKDKEKNSLWQKSNCDKTQELKVWQSSKT